MDIEIDYNTILGQGRQGRVYPVTRLNGIKKKDLIIKQYFDHTLVRRLKIFVDYINERNLLTEPALECLPFIFYRNGKHVGVIMKKAMGVSLENSYKELSKASLSSRLKYCHDISKGVRFLHESGIIHSDISDVNAIKNKDKIRLIDVDGGGIISKNIVPSIRGHGGGSWIAPEVFLDQNRLPDIQADEWSLAVLIHTILVPGIDPFYPLEKYFEIKNVTEWPLTKVKTDYREIKEVQISFLSACEPVFDLLKITFAQGMWSPERRISASRFEETLAFCLRNIIRCPHCREEIIVANSQKCPFCGVTLAAATLKIREKEYQLNSYRLHLTPEDFGLSGRTSLIFFELNNNKVLCRLMKDIKARYGGRVFSQNETLQIPLEKLSLLEMSYKDYTLPIIIQTRNTQQKPEIPGIIINENNYGNSNSVNNKNVLHKRTRRIRKKKGFWCRLFGF